MATTFSCSSATGPGLVFQVSENRWDARGSTDYTFVFRQRCECLVTEPVLVTVRNDDVVDVVALPGTTPPIGPLDPAAFLTIDEMFVRLRAIAETDPARFDVWFDDELGYPTHAIVDPSTRIADDEFEWEVSEVALEEPLEL
jgi:hypothetical protein